MALLLSPRAPSAARLLTGITSHTRGGVPLLSSSLTLTPTLTLPALRPSQLRVPAWPRQAVADSTRLCHRHGSLASRSTFVSTTRLLQDLKDTPKR